MLQAGVLLTALNSLESAITCAKRSFGEGAHGSPDVLSRFDAYLEVVRRQKVLAQSLARFAAEQNWDEVRRHQDLIRGSSQLIQLEVQGFIQSLLAHRAVPTLRA